jgi:hypothetical protein
MRRQIVTAGSVCVNLFPVSTFIFRAHSACVNNFFAHAQPAYAIFLRTLSMRKKHKLANICRSLRNKIKKFSSPQVTYPYRIYWFKKNWLKISHLGTCKRRYLLVQYATQWDLKKIWKYILAQNVLPLMQSPARTLEPLIFFLVY